MSLSSQYRLSLCIPLDARSHLMTSGGKTSGQGVDRTHVLV